MPDTVECPHCGSDNLEYRDVVSEREGETQKLKVDYFCKVCGKVFQL
ncbi:MAG: hypothetical protein ACLFVX_02495 [Archaeoglobaceae archaeon]